MPITIDTFPTEYLDVLDQAFAPASFAQRYNVGAAEFVNGRQVSVPSIEFPNATVKDYDRFKSDAGGKLTRKIYELAHDKECVFYLDALDEEDTNIAVTEYLAQWEQEVFAPFVDTDFFKVAAAKSKGKGSAKLTVDNIKKEIRKARTQLRKAGLSGGELYMTSDALGLLEDSMNRQYDGTDVITDSVGKYNGFDVFEVDDERLGADFIAIGGGTNTIRYITKRAALYVFMPGEHQSGDGSLSQNRFVFGSVVRKNKVAGIYAHNPGTTTVETPDSGEQSGNDGGGEQGGQGGSEQS